MNLNKKVLSLIITSVLLVTTTLVSTAAVYSSKTIPSSGSILQSNTIVVATDGSGDFTSIVSAINSVPNGQAADILIKQGTYILNNVQKWPPNQIIAKSHMTIRGEGIDKTIIMYAPTPQVSLLVKNHVVTSTSAITDFTLSDLTINQNAPAPDNAGSSIIAIDSSNNLRFERVKVLNAYGAGIGVSKFDTVTIDGCEVYNTWTGINLYGGKNAVIRNSKVVGFTGNGIFPQAIINENIIVTDITIQNNYIENLDVDRGDTAIGVGGIYGLPPMERMTIQGNTIKTRDCEGIGLAWSKYINVLDNTIETYSALPFYADAGQGQSSNILAKGNKITTHYKAGLAFYATRDCDAIGNQVNMLTPYTTGIKQIGILPIVRDGSCLIENNTITGSANYGISWEGWSISNTYMRIRRNTILDFGEMGIYDGGVNQGLLLVEYNTVWDRRTPFISTYGIRAEYHASRWTIQYNRVYAGRLGFIVASECTLIGNVYAPP